MGRIFGASRVKRRRSSSWCVLWLRRSQRPQLRSLVRVWSRLVESCRRRVWSGRSSPVDRHVGVSSGHVGRVTSCRVKLSRVTSRPVGPANVRKAVGSCLVESVASGPVKSCQVPSGQVWSSRSSHVEAVASRRVQSRHVGSRRVWSCRSRPVGSCWVQSRQVKSVVSSHARSCLVKSSARLRHVVRLTPPGPGG